MEVWSCECMEISQGMEVFRYEDIKVWRYGDIEILKYGDG